MTNPFVSIIVPAFNEQEHISRCLQALRCQTYPKNLYEIIVVDNGSTDSTLQIASQCGADRVEIIQNCNVGAVRNYGAKVAKGKILAFIDADCVPDSDWVEMGVSLIAKQKNGAVGGGCKLDNKATWVEKSWLLGDLTKIVPKELIGANIFIYRSDFQKISGFNENVSSGEDTDLSLRLRRNNYLISMKSKINVIHLGNAKSLRTFFKRQVWHSENYVVAMRSSIKDPVFILVCIYIFLFLCFISSLVFGGQPYSIGLLLLLVPCIFSVKRVKRSGIKVTPIKNIITIYTLDLIYVIARSIGLLKGLLKHGRYNRKI